MAITKLLRIKESKQGDPGSGLKRCLTYVCNPDKTEDGMLLSGNAGTHPALAYSSIKLNKLFWGKEEGSQGFHYVISFHPDEDVPPELALQIAEEFVKELLHDEHIYLIAVHTDTDHCHAHIVFDAVNFKSGKVFHSPRYDWLARIQPITDGLCKKYHLSTLSYDEDKERRSMYHKEWEKLKDGDPNRNVSWNQIIRDDIDECLGAASSWEDFLSKMAARHYTYHDGKYLSLRPFGKEKAIRSIRLGPGYSKEELQSRIGKKKAVPPEGRDYKTYGDSIPVYRSTFNYYRRRETYSPYQRQAWNRWHRLSHIRRPGVPTWKYKKDAARIGALASQLIYLFDHDITGSDDLKARLNELYKQRGTDAARERKLCRSILQEHQLSQCPEDIINDPAAHDVPMPTLQNIKQVSINKVLFVSVDLSKETFTIRIPGTDDHAVLYSDDSRPYNNGEMISSYIFPEAEYDITDQNGALLRRIKGEELSKHFKTREITRKEPDNKWKTQN